VVDAADVLANPARTLERLCLALELPYTQAMLRWSPGRRASDGVWAPAWYHAVEQSTGFDPQEPKVLPPLPEELRPLEEAALPHYDALRVHRL
jgi:hypothetical protein